MDVTFYLELQKLPVRQPNLTSAATSYTYSPFSPITVKQLMLLNVVQVCEEWRHFHEYPVLLFWAKSQPWPAMASHGDFYICYGCFGPRLAMAGPNPSHGRFGPRLAVAEPWRPWRILSISHPLQILAMATLAHGLPWRGHGGRGEF